MSSDDVLAIHTLLADYNLLSDDGSADAWADLFTDDGWLDPGTMPKVGGRDALVAWARAVPQMIPGARHLVANVSVQVTGTSAIGRCYLQLWVPRDGAMSLMMSGRYRDTFVKIDGEWRIASRELSVDGV
jgi:ketosteroid isomerase-like protein